MALSDGLKNFVNIITKGFSDGNEDDAFDFDNGMDDYSSDVDGTLALDTMYGTRVKPSLPERSFERESKVVSHPNNYKSSEVTVIEPRSFSEAAQIVKKLIDKRTVILHLDLLDKEQSQRTTHRKTNKLMLRTEAMSQRRAAGGQWLLCFIRKRERKSPYVFW